MNKYDDIWKTVVSVTNRMGYIAQTMRIPLYTALTQEESINYKRHFKEIINTGKLVLQKYRPEIPKSKKNKIMFIFPYSSPSNMNNITPVAIEAKKRGLISAIIRGSDVSKYIMSDFNDIPTLSYNDIMGIGDLHSNLIIIKEAIYYIDNII